MEVFVTNVFGRSVTCLIEETWTVQQLKDTYAQELETSSTNWYLMFNGKFLQNQKRILDYDVMQGKSFSLYFTSDSTQSQMQTPKFYQKPNETSRKRTNYSC